jgi:CHAT domain-containing protein/tetratricopeptide (TPR) repeat protein
MRKNTWLLLVLLQAAALQAQGPVRPNELLASAKEAYTQQGPAAALPQFEKALTIFRGAHDERNEAVTLGYLANCHRRLGNLKQALELGREALATKERLEDRDEIGKTHNQLGLIYWELADYPAAIKELEQAIELGRSLGDLQLEGSAANNLGLVFDEQGDHQASLKQYRLALELNRKSHFERGEGDVLGNIGGVSLLLGRFREALGYYREALAISQRLGLKPAETDDLGNIAVCLNGIGEIDESLSTFDEALKVAHEAGLSKEGADWRRGKGTALAGLGRYDAALDENGKAQEVYEQSGLKRELVESLIEKGRLHELLGDTQSAAKSFHRARAIAESIGNGPGVLSSVIALGDLERRRKRHEAAEEYFDSAMRSARAAGDTQNILEALIDRSTNDLARKRFDAALESATEAKRLAEGNGNRPAVALASYLEGEVNRARGNLEQALEQYAYAADLQKELRDPELGWRILFGRGETLQALGKDKEALASYKKSVELIERTRSAIGEERFRAGYIEERFQVYVALVELLLKMGEPGDAFFYSEKLRARAYFDQLGRSEQKDADPARQQRARELSQQLAKLREQIEKEYSADEKERHGQALEMFSQELERTQTAYEELLEASRGASQARGGVAGVPEASTIQERIPARTALVEYVVGKQSLSILVIRKESVNGTRVQVGSEKLAARIDLFRDLILAKKRDWVEPGRGLVALLIAPLERSGYLRHIERLVIVPDGVLNYIPFAALPTRGSRVLGDDFVISYLPAASALLQEKSTSGSGRTLLAMAPSASHLPNAVSEIRSIGELFPQGSRVVSGNQATKTLFKQIAGQYDFVHLATHGSLNRDAPWLSTLQLQPDNQSDGRLELHEIIDLKLHARLVTLSACETALGSGYFSDTPAGNEFVGMARAFLGAGSQSVLASLWAVNDESTRALMVRFYRNLRLFDGPEALARAQRELRLSGSRYGEPYYWAPFVLVGAAK